MKRTSLQKEQKLYREYYEIRLKNNKDNKYALYIRETRGEAEYLICDKIDCSEVSHIELYKVKKMYIPVMKYERE